MFANSKRTRYAAACLCTAIAAAGYFLAPAHAEPMKDDMKPAMTMPDKMMSDQMMMAKDGMKDDAAKMQMTHDLAKMMVMHQMAMQMCADDKCAAMMKEPGMTAMADDAKKMAADPAKMAAMRDEISKDPAMMRMTMMMSMAHASMMPMKDINDGKMNDGMKHDEKMK